MNTQTIDINKVTPADFSQYSVNELVYIYLAVFQIPKNYSLEILEHKTALHTDFLEFAKDTRHHLTEKQFIENCKWWWNLIPLGNEPELKLPKQLPLFSYYSKPVTNTTPRTNINLLQLAEVIRNPKYFGRQTEELRAIATPEIKRKYKATQFDYVTFSGTFEKRNSQSCTTPSGYLCLDIDHYKGNLNELKNQLIKDQCIEPQLIFVSPSGDGLKVVIPYDTNEFDVFTNLFIEVEDYFMETYNLQIDKSGKNIDRACFICHDPDMYLSENLKTR